MKKISIIGAGTMGNGIAHCFAQKEFQVSLIDLSSENLIKAETTINKNLDRMIKKSVITEQDKKSIISRICFQTDMDQSVKDSDLVIEAVTESRKIKLNIFTKLDSLCKPETILASHK